MRTNGSDGARDVVRSTTQRCKAVGTTMRRNTTRIARQVRAASVSSETVLCPILWGINLSHIYAREVR